MNKERNNPEIRLEGAEGDWEKYKFDDIAQLINGRAYKQNELLDDGKYKVLRVGNFYTNEDWYYSNLELADKYYANNGDLLYTWSASFGPHIWNGEKVIYHYHIWKVVLSEKLDKLFTVSLLEYDKANILSDSNGSTMIHITKSGLENKNFIIPELGEQKFIGKYFEKIGENIHLRKTELSKLIQLKQAMLQKMFPKEGKKVPEVRFEEFEGEWEFRELGNLTSVSTGNSDLQDAVPNGKYPLYVRSEKIQRSNRYLFDGEAILIPGEGRLGEIFHYINGKFDFHQRVYKISDFLNTDAKFVMYYMKRDFKKHALKNTAKATVDSLRMDVITEFNIPLPSIKEQKVISEYFYGLEKNIQSKQAELDKLKQFKQAMLDKMFV